MMLLSNTLLSMINLNIKITWKRVIFTYENAILTTEQNLLIKKS